MSSWFFIGLCVAVLCLSPSAAKVIALPQEDLDSSNTVETHLESVTDARETSSGPRVTVAVLRIDSIQSQNFTWIDQIDFVVSANQTIETEALSNVDLYDYAEFDYPTLSNCTAGALRLQVNDELSVIFVIPLNVSDAQCNSTENLLKIFQDKDFESISFKSKRMFVRIPVLRVATTVIPAKKTLKQKDLRTPEPSASHTQPIFAGSYESSTLIFNPEMPKDAPIPMIHQDTPRFHAERPFLVAVLQKDNPVPVLFGLIQMPNKQFECCTPPETESSGEAVTEYE